MAEYIDRKQLMKERERAIQVYENANIFSVEAIRSGLKPLLNKIVDLPTADVVEVKHGKWAYKLDCNGYGCYECSCCNTLHEYDTDYCPNCGAKMDGERK